MKDLSVVLIVLAIIAGSFWVLAHMGGVTTGNETSIPPPPPARTVVPPYTPPSTSTPPTAPYMPPARALLKPSFNCAKARTTVEKTICNNDLLADADGRMSLAYNEVRQRLTKEQAAALKKRQVQWLKQRDRDILGRCRDGGEVNIPCAVNLYDDRIAELHREPSTPETTTPVPPPVAKKPPSPTVQPESKPPPAVSRRSAMPVGFAWYFDEYAGKPEKKAIAVAIDPSGSWAAGYSDSQSSQQEANDGALSGCAQRLSQYNVRAPCELYAVGSEIIGTADRREPDLLNRNLDAIARKQEETRRRMQLLGSGIRPQETPARRGPPPLPVERPLPRSVPPPYYRSPPSYYRAPSSYYRGFQGRE